ncbi:delta-like protein D isoform X1 [Oscarella lobularis]|uniref:delta-like protein D isoform X1 n=1 Tax=Oscarella lobularis TaxID=121494 RepID=UPI003313F8E4
MTAAAHRLISATKESSCVNNTSYFHVISRDSLSLIGLHPEPCQPTKIPMTVSALFVLCFIATRQVISAGPGGAIVTNLVSYFDAVRTLPSGDCCRGSPLDGTCEDTCHNVLRVCLVDSQGHSSEVQCLSDYTTDEFVTTWPAGVKTYWGPQKHVFKSTETSLRFSGPIIDGLALLINASHVNESRKTIHIATFTYPLPEDTSLTDRGSWSDVALSFPQRSSVTYTTQWIDLRWKVVCEENYYGKCDVFCTPKDDDTNGHYTCDPATGDKVCCDGYKDVDTNCVKSEDLCLSNPCTNDAKCSEAVECTCPGDPTCDSTSCKNLKQCKMRPSFTCLCTSQYEGQYCEKKKAPLSAGGYVGISVGAVTVLVILIIMLRKKIAAAWSRRRSGYRTL